MAYLAAAQTEVNNDEELMNIGGKIRKERKARGLSLKDLAEGCGLSVMTLQRIETEKTSPSVATLSRIAHHLLRPICFFIGKEEPNTIAFGEDDLRVVEPIYMTLQKLASMGLIEKTIFAEKAQSRFGQMRAHPPALGKRRRVSPPPRKRIFNRRRRLSRHMGNSRVIVSEPCVVFGRCEGRDYVAY